MTVSYVRIQKSKNSCISCPLDDGKKIQYRKAVIFYTKKTRRRETVQESSLKRCFTTPLNNYILYRNDSVGPILCFSKWQLHYSQFTATCYYVYQP